MDVYACVHSNRFQCRQFGGVKMFINKSKCLRLSHIGIGMGFPSLRVDEAVLQSPFPIHMQLHIHIDMDIVETVSAQARLVRSGKAAARLGHDAPPLWPHNRNRQDTTCRGRRVTAHGRGCLPGPTGAWTAGSPWPSTPPLRQPWLHSCPSSATTAAPPSDDRCMCPLQKASRVQARVKGGAWKVCRRRQSPCYHLRYRDNTRSSGLFL